MEVSENDKAAIYLEEELQLIKDRFDNGEMRAFGTKEEDILKEFKEIRQKQAQLAMKQVSMLGEMMNPTAEDLGDGIDIAQGVKEKEQSMELLTSMLDDVCKAMSNVNKIVRKM